MRRATLFTVVCLLAVTSVVATAGPALANKPTQIYTQSIHFVCSDVRTPDGVVQISAELFSEFNEADASINYWVPPETPENSQDSTYRSSSLIEDQHVTLTGHHFDGTLVMEDRDFNPVGNATFSVDLIPTTGVEKTGGRSKNGNRNIHDNSTVQFFSVAGSVKLHDGKVFDLTNCVGPDGAPPDRAGAELIEDVRITDPSQFTISFVGTLVLCDISTPDYALNLGASNEQEARTDLAFEDANGLVFGFSDGITLTPTELSGTVPLNDDNGEPAGEAVVDVSFARGHHTVIRTQEGGIRSNREGFLLIPSGTISFPDGTVVDMSPCFAFDGREQQKEHRPTA